MKKIFRTVPALAIAATIALSAASALANTAANTDIVNRARLSYNGTLSAESIITVKVGLIPATPNVQIGRADAAYVAPNSPSKTNTVTITSTANGSADYLVTPSVIASTHTTVPGIAGGATVTVGATVTTGTSGTTYVTVPASGATGASPASINGIAVGDRIIFTVGVTEHSLIVSGFTDNGDSTYKINWTSGAIAVAPSAGTQVGERLDVSLTATPGTIIPADQGLTITTTIQAVVSTGAAPFGGAPAPADRTVDNSVNPNKWTSTSPSILFQKYSRNVYSAAGNLGASGNKDFSINGSSSTYYTTDVKGKPGDTIEYVINAKNSGAAAITATSISDLLPTNYVNDPLLVYGGGAGHIWYINTLGTGAAVLAGAPGANLASWVSTSDPNLIINVGVGATGALAGSIPPGLEVTVAYQVTIK